MNILTVSLNNDRGNMGWLSVLVSNSWNHTGRYKHFGMD